LSKEQKEEAKVYLLYLIALLIAIWVLSATIWAS
jgi:predicted nucleic acid-binding Zn ribbon protein